MGKGKFSEIGKYKQYLSYMGCAGAANCVDAAIYFPLFNFTSVPAPVCILISSIFCFTTAFLLMKPFVFCSKDWSKDVVIREFIRFITTRTGTMLLEILFSFVMVTLCGLDGNWMRIVGWTLVAAINYTAAKYVVFKYRTYR